MQRLSALKKGKKSLLRVFFEKPFSEKFLLLQVFVLLSLFRLLIIFMPFKKMAPLLGKHNQTASGNRLPSEWEWVQTVARFIRQMSKLLPWKSECLVQAATGKLLLRRKKIASTVYFGVKKSDDSKKILAHAWLKVGPEIILGGENAHQYVVVSTFS
jgi:hypothetical protein